MVLPIFVILWVRRTFVKSRNISKVIFKNIFSQIINTKTFLKKKDIKKKSIPSYEKDTNDFINKIITVKSVPKNSYLVTMNVKSLYTNIPNAEGISSVKRAFCNYSKKTTTTKVITTFLSLILTLNNFVFNCIHYLQIKEWTHFVLLSM